MTDNVHANRQANRNTALQFIWPAYELSQQRLDSLNRRLEWLMATPIGLIPLMLTVGSEQPILTCWFIAASTLALIATGVAYWGRRRAMVQTFALRSILEYDHAEPVEFGRWLLDWAGKHIACDGRANQRKSRYADIAAVCIVAELICLVIWAAT